MIRRKPALLVLLGLLVVALAAPAVARADFGLLPGGTSLTALNKDGTIDEAAGTHPADVVLSFELKTDSSGRSEGEGARDILFDAPAGLIGNPTAVPSCSRQQFDGLQCSAETQVGFLHATIPSVGQIQAPVFNVTPPPGVPTLWGFVALGQTVLQYASLRTEAGYILRVSSVDTPLEITAASETIWGVPADPANDAQRRCKVGGIFVFGCSSSAALTPYLTLPASCAAPMKTTVQVDSKAVPGIFTGETIESLNGGGVPAPLSGCEAVPFSPQIASQPTSKLASNPSGLSFQLKLRNQGLESVGATAETEPRKVVVTLPEGVGINPSLAEGIATCSEAQYRAEQLETAAGAGCPEASKLGSVLVHTPLLREPLEGSLYLAAPYENEFGTLAAIYMVARASERGIFVKQAGKVEFNQATGQITTTFEGLPPLPFSDFRLHFREGARAPLSTPQACGEYKSVAELTPFSSEAATERTAFFRIERGATGGACPSGGTPPFQPGLIAGTINNAAGRYSPFDVRLFRTDSEQEMTHFSIKLPPGVTGKLAGIPFCSDLQIAAAKARERTEHGGQEEIDHPSCPAASEIGHTLVGAGVGPSLTYVPGKVYLAGPYHGSNLSIVAITAAKAGPFDLGTVVIREALKVDPETAEVSVDAAGSDPIPHIVNGIPVHARDIRVYVDRPGFVLNPTDCKATSTASTVLGSGTNFATEADDRPVTVTTRFQAADCASLGFGPRIKLMLKGQTKRTGLPRLKAVVRPRPGDANIGRAVVTLPRSEFLEQGHIGTTCTRVQFNAGGGNGEQCPANSVYGRAKAWTPLLSEPLTGPVFLRSNGGERKLPDMVAAMHTKDINIDLLGFIKSLHPKGASFSRIRTIFASVPDAPVSRFTLEMFGGKKSLLINSVNLCKGKHRAISTFVGQNGKKDETHPAVRVRCKRKGKRHHKKAHGHSRHTHRGDVHLVGRGRGR